MSEDMVDVQIRLDRKTMAILNGMTKQKLMERICTIALEIKVAENKAEAADTKLLKSEAYLAQARAMIDAVMERWDEYDV